MLFVESVIHIRYTSNLINLHGALLFSDNSLLYKAMPVSLGYCFYIFLFEFLLLYYMPCMYVSLGYYFCNYCTFMKCSFCVTMLMVLYIHVNMLSFQSSSRVSVVCCIEVDMVGVAS